MNSEKNEDEHENYEEEDLEIDNGKIDFDRCQDDDDDDQHH